VGARASKNEIADLGSESIRIKLTAPPIEGKANRALIRLLASVVGVSQKDVEIVSGLRSRQKTVGIRGLAADEVLSRFKEKRSTQRRQVAKAPRKTLR
jgi:hypothetical protein